jgi:hypothetical protein
MSKTEPPVGRLFSRVYLERQKPARDSQRFRTRLYGYYSKALSGSGNEVASAIRLELGVEVPYNGYYDFAKFFFGAQIRDVLDTISLMKLIIERKRGREEAREFLTFVQRVFDEESVGYRVDSQGGVHYVVDEEFERNRVAAVASLTTPKYAAVAASLEQAFSHLDTQDVNTKTAVRDVFEAMETLIKITTDSNKNLDDKMVKKELGELLRKIPEYTEPSGASTVSKFIESLADWVNAAHPYRHGQKTETLVAPSLPSAVLFLSTGAAYIRWLVDQLGTTKQ